MEDDFLRGQVHALTVAMFALISTHPNKLALLGALQEHLEFGLAKSLNSPMPEAHFDGVQDMTDRMMLYARHAAGGVALAQPARVE